MWRCIRVYHKASDFSQELVYEYQDSLTDEIIRDDPPNIYESFVTDKSYHYGIGLHIVTHVDEINPKTI